ncbi:DUF3990 domain-containing protein [bacterium]|nr:DUF3990 domain-containing protein [bacterium]
MILYHASNIAVPKPDILHSRRNVDFGPGFYTTSLIEQAKKWCERFVQTDEHAVISKYELDDEVFQKCKVLAFDAYSDEWLDFVVKCRKVQDTSDFDIVMGGIANDKVFDTVELYLDGLIDRSVAIERLKLQQPNMQLAIRHQEVIEKYLHYIGSETIC